MPQIDGQGCLVYIDPSMLRKHHIFSRRMSISVLHPPPLAFLRSFACPMSSPYAFDIEHVRFCDEAIPSLQYINTHFLHGLLAFLPLTAATSAMPPQPPALSCSVCNKPASEDAPMKRCSRCRARFYCGTQPVCNDIPAIVADPSAQARTARPRTGRPTGARAAPPPPNGTTGTARAATGAATRGASS
jgi:hypothetical protein